MSPREGNRVPRSDHIAKRGRRGAPAPRRPPARGDGARASSREDGLQSRSLTDQVYDHLKKLIVAGRLLPGQQIVEDRVTRELAVSRTPVREALQRLEFEGLVDVRAHKGTFVSLIDGESLREIFEFREAIEGQAARLAVSRMDEPTRASLQQLLRAFQEAVAAADPKRFYEADTRLHRTLVIACGNRRIQRTIEILESQIARTRFLSIIALNRMERSSSEHEAIVRAVVRGDAREAEETMRNHIRAVYQNLAENLSRFTAGDLIGGA